MAARICSGTVVIRRDEFDNLRPEEEWQPMISGLTWLGLDWAEGLGKSGQYGPYDTGERRQLYSACAGALQHVGRAYVCDCEPEQYVSLRQTAGGGYNGKCRDRGLPLEAGAIRFRTDALGETVLSDLVTGTKRLTNRAITDPILIRRNGNATFYMTNAVDDHYMNIGMSIRDSTPTITQVIVQIMESLGIAPPLFLHLGEIRRPDGASKLSSPTFGVEGFDIADVEAYKKAGYLPLSVISMLLRTLIGGKQPRVPESLGQAARRLDWRNVIHTPIRLPIQELPAIEDYWRARGIS